jgi:outer membrane biosynthesis protein TonB
MIIVEYFIIISIVLLNFIFLEDAEATNSEDKIYSSEQDENAQKSNEASKTKETKVENTVKPVNAQILNRNRDHTEPKKAEEHKEPNKAEEHKEPNKAEEHKEPKKIAEVVPKAAATAVPIASPVNEVNSNLVNRNRDHTEK